MESLVKLIKEHNLSKLFELYTVETLPEQSTLLALALYTEKSFDNVPKNVIGGIGNTKNRLIEIAAVYNHYYRGRPMSKALLKLAAFYNQIEIVYYLLARDYVQDISKAMCNAIKSNNQPILRLLASKTGLTFYESDVRRLLKTLLFSNESYLDVLLVNQDIPFGRKINGITFAGILAYRQEYRLFARLMTDQRHLSARVERSHCRTT